MNKTQFRKAFPYLLTWNYKGSATNCSLSFESESEAKQYASKVFKEASNINYKIERLEQ